jgi:hypothetical protein
MDIQTFEDVSNEIITNITVTTILTYYLTIILIHLIAEYILSPTG